MTTATNPCTGKTLLADLLMTLHGGMQRARCPATMRSYEDHYIDVDYHTAPIVPFDNLAGTVKSPAPHGLLTAKTWTDRWPAKIQRHSRPPMTGSGWHWQQCRVRRRPGPAHRHGVHRPTRAESPSPHPLRHSPTWTTGWWSTGASTWRPSSPWTRKGERRYAEGPIRSILRQLDRRHPWIDGVGRIKGHSAAAIPQT